MSLPLEKPSDLFDAIAARLREAILDIAVGDYADFGARQIGKARTAGEILIEFERMPAIARGADGRYGHEFAVTLHCVVGRQRHRAPLEAVNLAAAVQRIVTDNRWGLPPTQLEEPEALRAEPSFFQEGANGYEAWGVSFNQKLWLGPSLAEEDPVTVALPQIAWNAEDSLDASDESSYTPLDEPAP